MAGPTDHINQASVVAEVTKGLDPAVQMVIAILFALGLVGGMAYSWLRSVRREDSSDNLAKTKNTVESDLIRELSEERVTQRQRADEAMHERNELKEQVSELKAEMKQLTLINETYERVKVKLDEKDEELRSQLSQQAEERKQFLNIIQSLRDEVSSLRERLERDEAQALKGATHCPFHPESIERRREVPNG